MQEVQELLQSSKVSNSAEGQEQVQNIDEIKQDGPQNEDEFQQQELSKSSSQKCSQNDEDSQKCDENESECSSEIEGLEDDEYFASILEKNTFFPKKDIYKYYKQFLEIDLNKNGYIDLEELKQFLLTYEIQLDDQELLAMIQEFGREDQNISFEEFLVLLQEIMTGKKAQKDQQELKSEKNSNTSKIGVQEQLLNIQEEVSQPIQIKEEQIKLAPLFPEVIQIKDKAFEFEKNISLEKLRQYLNETHPREEVEIEVERRIPSLRKSKRKRKSFQKEIIKIKDKEKFNCCLQNIGVLALGKEPKQLTEVENEIGIGMTIYFRQLKLLTILFFVFMIFSVPQVSLFYTSSQKSSLNPNQDFISFFVKSIWFRFTLGGVGRSDFFCTSVQIRKLAENNFPGLPILIPAVYDSKGNIVNATVYGAAPQNITNLTIQCPNAGIQNLVELGLSQWNSRCPSSDIDSAIDQQNLLQILNIDPDCSFRSFSNTSSQFQQIISEFMKLQNQQSGNFGLNPKKMLTEACYNKTQSLNYMTTSIVDKTSFQWSPQIYMLVQCLDRQFLNPATGNTNIDRIFILQIMIITDCIIVFLYIMIIIFMQKVSDRAVNEFRSFKNTLETKDFSVIVQELPSVKHYKNEQILKTMLINHFENIINTEQQQIPEMESHQKYQNQVVEIFFGKVDYGPFDKLMEIKNLYQQIFYLIVKSQNTNKSYFKSITKIQKQIEKQKCKYIQLQNAYYEKEQAKESLKYQLKQSGHGNIQNAFIIFRSMEGQKRVIAAYDQDKISLQRFLYKFCCWMCILCCWKKEDKLLFMHKFKIKVSQASNPDHINWDNITRQNKCKKCCNGFCTFLFSFFLIAVILGILWGKQYFLNQFQQTYPPYNIVGNNPQYYKLTTNQSAALLDLTNGTLVFENQQEYYKIIGVMTAYCDYAVTILGQDPSTIIFDDQNTHCYNIKIWRNVIKLINILIAFILVIWTYFSNFIFENCIGCMYSYIDTQEMYEFKTASTLVVTFINSIIILMLNSYNLKFLPSLLNNNLDFITNLIGVSSINLAFIYQYLPILTGQYSDLTIGWYLDVGQTICWILVIWLILTSISRVIQLIVYNLKIYCDGNCLFSKQFGTLKRTQIDLNNFYKGDEFNISYNYIKIHFFVWICMTFSTTIPILYMITFIFLLFKYWSDKYLVLNYFRKTTSFNEQVPLNQIKYFKWPILFHVLCTVVTLSGNQMLFQSHFVQPTNQTQQQSNLNIPISINLGGNINQLQASQNIDISFTPQTQTIISRFLQTHMIVIYVFWIFTFFCYVLQEQIEKCFYYISKVLKGDEEDDKEGSEEEEFQCHKCEEQKLEEERKRERVKQMLNKSKQKKLSKVVDKYNILNSSIKIKKYADSSEDETQFKLEDFNEKEESDNQEEQNNNIFGNNSDDFFKEIRVDQLIQYYENNDFEMQKIIHTLSKNHLFNPQLKHASASSFVGDHFNQTHMKQMIGIVRRRRKTFQRRITQIMARMNPHIKQYFASPHEYNIPIFEDPFKDQVEILKHILIKDLYQYKAQGLDENHDEDLEVTLNINCIEQKQMLIQLNQIPRIKQSAQSYDFLDQTHYQGVMSLYKLYLPDVKSSFVFGKQKLESEKNSSQVSEKTLSEEPQLLQEEEQEVVSNKVSEELQEIQEGSFQNQKSIELQNLLESNIDKDEQPVDIEINQEPQQLI